MRGLPRLGALAALLVPAACGEVNVTPDAPLDPDTPPAPAVHRWVISGQVLPRNNPEAVMYGLDLDGDGVVDNQLGLVIGALTAQGFDIQAAADAAIARGTILMLGEAAIGGAAPTDATFRMYAGANPQPAPCSGVSDPVCRRHLTGSATFDVMASSARPPLAGTLANGTLLAGPGVLQISTVLLGPTPVSLDLIGARVRLQSVTAGSLGQSVIAGAITQSEIDAKIYPSIHQNASAAVAADCTGTMPPGCGCTAGSTGRTQLSLFDTSPQDCAITLQEVRASTLLQSLLAPDVNIGGEAALSSGFGATAVQATFTP